MGAVPKVTGGEKKLQITLPPQHNHCFYFGCQITVLGHVHMLKKKIGTLTPYLCSCPPASSSKCVGHLSIIIHKNHLNGYWPCLWVDVVYLTILLVLDS